MTTDRPFFPYGRQCIDDDDIAAVTAVLRSDWLTTGPAVTAFESALAGKVGARNAVSCANGTAALHLAALALELGPGDAVIVPAMTFLATANAARFVGAEVIFADVDPDTGLMRPEDLENALMHPEAANARAVFPVHYAGQCCDMAGLHEIARRQKLFIVEDACHALGTAYRGGIGENGVVGDCRWSDMAVFSFHPVKIIAMGEGGAVTTNDSRLSERLARLRNHGMVRDESALVQQNLARAVDGTVNPWYYEMPEIGFNYRASDLNCALGLSQLNKLDRFVSRRRELAARYNQALESLSPIVRPLGRVPWCEAALHLYAVLIDFSSLPIDRAVFMRQLRSRGIGTQVHYIPLHLQPYYCARYGRQTLPGAESFYSRVLSLPFFPMMSDGDCLVVAEVLGAEVTSPRSAAYKSNSW